MVLRLYGKGRVIARLSQEYDRLLAEHFEARETPGARQMIWLDVHGVQTSCGMNVPLFDYAGERDQLIRWAEKQGEAGLEEYWSKKNRQSIDGFPTPFAQEVVP